jgi:hypothetical protein
VIECKNSSSWMKNHALKCWIRSKLRKNFIKKPFFSYKLSEDVAKKQNNRIINLREGEKPKNVRQFQGKTLSKFNLLNTFFYKFLYFCLTRLRISEEKHSLHSTEIIQLKITFGCSTSWNLFMLQKFQTKHLLRNELQIGQRGKWSLMFLIKIVKNEPKIGRRPMKGSFIFRIKIC